MSSVEDIALWLAQSFPEDPSDPAEERATPSWRKGIHLHINPWEYMMRYATPMHPEVKKAAQEEAFLLLRVELWRQQQNPDRILSLLHQEANALGIPEQEILSYAKEQLKKRKTTADKNKRQAERELEKVKWRREQLERLHFSTPNTDDMLRAWHGEFCGDYHIPSLQEILRVHPKLPREEARAIYYQLTNGFAVSMAWLRLLVSPQDPTPHHQLIARDVIGESGEGAVVDTLAREHLEQLRKFRRALSLEAPTLQGVLEPQEEKGMLWLDARAFDFLKSQGEGGKQAARFQEDRSRGRWAHYASQHPSSPQTRANAASSSDLWRLWADLSPGRKELEGRGLPPVRIALILAAVIWRDTVKPRIERERIKHPAVVRPLLDTIGRVYHAKGRVIQKTEQGPKLFSKTGEELAVIDTPIFSLADLEAAQRKIELLRSLTGHKALRHQIIEGHRRVLHGKPDPRRIGIRGGWATYAEMLGLKGSKAAKELADIVRAEAITRFLWPNGKVGNLLALSETVAKGQHASEIVLVLGDIILPDYFRALPKDGTRERQEQRQLIPIPQHLPPLVGRPNDHAAQAAFQLQILWALRIRAEELATEGSAHLSRRDFEPLAERAELPGGLINPVLERWTQGEDAFLEEPSPERYTLAKNYGNALEFLVKGGKKTIDGKKGGKTRKEKKKTTPRGKKGSR